MKRKDATHACSLIQPEMTGSSVVQLQPFKPRLTLVRLSRTAFRRPRPSSTPVSLGISICSSSTSSSSSSLRKMPMCLIRFLRLVRTVAAAPCQTQRQASKPLKCTLDDEHCQFVEHSKHPWESHA